MKTKRTDLFYLIFFTIILHIYFISIVYRGGGDDTNFVTLSAEYSLLGWIKNRFMTWSARLGSEMFIWLFAKLDIIWWRLVTLLCEVLWSVYLYKFSILFGGREGKLQMCSCALLPFLFNLGTFVDGALWVTGTINYLWVMVPGFIASYYLVRNMCYDIPIPIWGKVTCTIGLLITVSSSEQLGACIVTLYGIWIAYLIIKRKKDVYAVFNFFSCLFMLLVTVVLAPGVNLRRESLSLDDYIINYDTLKVFEQMNFAIRWTLDALINHLGYVLIFIWLFELLLFILKKDKRVIQFIPFLFITIGTIFLLVKEILVDLFRFEIYLEIDRLSVFNNIKIILWSSILLMTVFTTYIVIETIQKKIDAILLLLAIYTSSAILVFSRTHYASGCRTMFQPTVLGLLLILLLKGEIKKEIVLGKITISYQQIMDLALIIGSIIHWIELFYLYTDGYFYHFEW